MPFDQPFIRARLERSARVISDLAAQADRIESVARFIADTLRNGGTLYTCGNGGSAAEALHLAEELIGRYKRDRAPKRAVCLNADPTALTCIANDFGYDHVFARQAQALCRPGDALVAFSTSGNSPNIIEALKAARHNKCTTIGLLGKSGGPALAHCDHSIVVNSNDTESIQEAHQVILHLILEAVEAST